MSSGDGLTPEIEALAPALAAACDRLGLSLDAQARRQLLRYLGLLLRWNSTYNLTSVREPNAMLTHHLVDCLAVDHARSGSALAAES